MLSGLRTQGLLLLALCSGVQFFLLDLLGEGRRAEFPRQYSGAAILSAAFGIGGVRRKRRRYPKTVKSARTV
jgi:hypothetical protein